MSKDGILSKVHKPGKKTVIFIIIAVAIVAALLVWSNFFTGQDKVEFKTLTESEIPQEIVSQVIPEYRQMERALACVINDKVYVVATRGEKPTSGYEITIENMALEEENDQVKLEVGTIFKDPEPNTALTQVLTYPIQVAETNLKKLPDKIELKVKYLD